MPPKHKFSKTEIISAALNLVRKDGFPALTARGLGALLGTSSHPIFTAFRNMEELQAEVIKAANDAYNEYIEKGLAEEIAFKGVGMQYLKFAREESRLFELLFMTAREPEQNPSDITIPLNIDDNSDRILASVQENYGLSRELAFRLYRDLWIFTHGIACLYVTGVSRLSEEQASELLTEVFVGLLIKMRSEAKND